MEHTGSRIGARRRARLAEALLYFVVEARPDVARAALEGGADIVQLRDKEADEDQLSDAAEEFRAACDEHDALFVLNDRPELALEFGADGVHVGQEDDSVGDVRAAVGRDVLIGVSTHRPQQFAAGIAAGADYLCAGPVWETPTKPGRPAAGLGYLREAAAAAGGTPWFAIGGIDPSNVGEVIGAGARRIVVVRAIRDAGDPAAAARALRAALEEAPDGVA